MHTSSSKPPIFLITHEFYPRRGGIATFAEEMALASAKLGYDIEVWAQMSSEQREKKWPFRLRRLPLKGTHSFLCLVKLIREFIAERRRLRYATVYLPEPGPIKAMLFLQYIKTFRPKNLILTFHGSEILRFHKNPLLRYLTKKLIQKATRISTLTHYTQNLLLEHFPEAEDKVFLTPGALRSDFAVVHAQGIKDKDKIIVLTVGRLHPRKGQLATVEALQALAPQFRDKIEYWIVGSQGKDGYEQRLRAAVARSDLTVRFFGGVTDAELDLIYDRADIFAMTSVGHGDSIEGFGLVYLEASAHGLPIVGHDIGGVSEAVLDGKTGILVPPDRPAQLTAAFEQLIATPSLRRQLGEAGKSWARQTHWSRSAQMLFGAGAEFSQAGAR